VDIKEEQLISFFSDMRNGAITKAEGGVYASVNTYAKVYKL